MGTKKDGPPILLGAIKLVQAFRPGDVVFLESDRVLSLEHMKHFHQEFKQRIPEIKVVILNQGLRVSGRLERDAPEVSDAPESAPADSKPSGA